MTNSNNHTEEAYQVLISLGLPRAQRNERSALCLLALLNLTPAKTWAETENPLIGITPIMDWLLLVESATSHGPVDGKRHAELANLFRKSTAGLAYVTAFPNRTVMGRYLGEIAWETDVWVADAPSHKKNHY